MMYNLDISNAVLDLRRVENMKNQLKRTMWELWKDLWVPSRPWRMMTPIGVLAFKTKKIANVARSMYERSSLKGKAA